MKIPARWLVGLCLAGSALAAQAQVPYIVGTWKLNVAASRLDGPAPQSEVRSYRLSPDGVLIGVAISVDDRGRPGFLQFAARPDGKDYPEFSTDSAARYLIDGTAPPRTYAEIPTADPYKVRWVDKAGGRVLASGEKWVSRDGKRLSFTADAKDQQGHPIQYLYVFDRTGP